MEPVRTLFFASYRELVGAASLEVSLGEATSVAHFVGMVRGRGAPFDRLPLDAAVAVNREVARPGTLVHPGDEVAFLPPVAGG